MPISRHGLREILIATIVLGAIAAGVVLAWGWYAAIPAVLLWAGVIAFFRDPPRRIPGEPGLLVAPADGCVTEISRIEHDGRISGPATKISIFLSVLDVHVNRSPCDGRVIAMEYQKGEFLDARHPESGTRNESQTLVILPDAPIPGPIVVRQVAGLIARRIICRANVGQVLTRGGRIGLIKFGSRTELIVPDVAGMCIDVTLGSRVRGGSSVMARFESAAAVRVPRDDPAALAGV